MEKVFRWGGQYFGFAEEGRLHNAAGRAVGFIAAGAVWRLDGSYLGEWLPEGYVLRPNRTDRPLRLAARPLCAPAAHHLPPAAPNRPRRPPRPGWTDGLRDVAD